MLSDNAILCLRNMSFCAIGALVLHRKLENRPFQRRAWSCITSYPLQGLPYLAYDNVNPAMVNSMMLRSSMLAFEKVLVRE